MQRFPRHRPHPPSPPLAKWPDLVVYSQDRRSGQTSQGTGPRTDTSAHHQAMPGGASRREVDKDWILESGVAMDCITGGPAVSPLWADAGRATRSGCSEEGSPGLRDAEWPVMHGRDCSKSRAREPRRTAVLRASTKSMPTARRSARAGVDHGPDSRPGRLEAEEGDRPGQAGLLPRPEVGVRGKLGDRVDRRPGRGSRISAASSASASGPGRPIVKRPSQRSARRTAPRSKSDATPSR